MTKPHMMMAQFYGTKMEPEEKCASFGTRLEQKLNQVSLQYPNKIYDSTYWNCVRERFFHGLSKNMRTNLRTPFDGGTNYYKLLKLARMIESENFHEDSKTVEKPTNPKGKSKVGAVVVNNAAQQIQQLQGAVKGLTKLLQGNQQNTQMQQIPQYVPNPVQNNSNSLPQASQSQNSINSQGGRGGYRGRGARSRGRGRGGLILCYWCRDFLPKDQANHKVAHCPYQSQARNDWWKSQLSSTQEGLPTTQTNEKENC